MADEKDNALGNLDDISFSDDDTPVTKGSRSDDQVVDAAKYFEDERLDTDQEDDGDTNWEDEARKDIEVQKKPFYLRPMFFIVLLIIVVLAVTLSMSLSKQKKRKAVSFGEESQQFSQPPPSISTETVQSPATPVTPEAQVVAPNGEIPATSQEIPPVAPVTSATTTAPTPQPAPPAAAPVVQATAAPIVAAVPSTTSPAIQTQQPLAGNGNNELIALENRMKAELRDVSSRNLALQREVRQLTERVNRLTKGSVASPGVAAQKILPEATQPQASAAPASPLSAFSIKAIRKGQAWIASSAGTYTVNVGDLLPGNIRVTGIDPDNLEVATSAGVIRYKK